MSAEADIVIFDTVRTEQLGFTPVTPRMGVATTQTRGGMIINLSSLYARREQRHFLDLFDHSSHDLLTMSLSTTDGVLDRVQIRSDPDGTRAVITNGIIVPNTSDLVQPFAGELGPWPAEPGRAFAHVTDAVTTTNTSE
ncbi:hypothetical protein LZ32DRAFT_614267 [Colletotrichum eremochloae]|nr:hypothetical protein LZ32DRAFT_614267 [Colletotrichum eremochloae]